MEPIGTPLLLDTAQEFVKDGPVNTSAAAQPDQPAVKQQVNMCLILESRLRGMLEKEKRALKRGKNRKLTKEDRKAIEEELEFLRFDPRKFAQEMIQMTRQAMQEPQQSIVLPSPAPVETTQNSNNDLAASTPPESSQ